jgi:hypothetical protein
MDQLSDAHLAWTSSFLSIHVDVLVSGRAGTTADEAEPGNGKLSAPMISA